MVSAYEPDCTVLITTAQNKPPPHPAQGGPALAVSSLLPFPVPTHNEVHRGARVIYVVDVLVLARIHAAAQFVAGGPKGGVKIGFLDCH